MTRVFARLIPTLLVLAACAKEEAAPPPSGASRGPSLERFNLAEDPGGGIAVLEARKTADGDVVVVGRVGWIVKGYGSFQLVDESLAYCGAGGDSMDDCSTPWDYCCISKDEKNAATLVVEAHDEAGRPVKTDALPGLRLLDLVAVKGKLTRDAHGNPIVVATGWHRRERPDLREGLHWPE